MNVWKHISECMKKYPYQTIREDTVQLSYEEILVFAESFGQRLTGQACCAIYCRSEMTAAMALLSCLAAGVTALPLSPRYGELHCQKIMNWIDPTCLITDTDGELRIHPLPASQYRPPTPSPALIMCTSGTTGIPKGAMLSESNILANLQDIDLYFPINSTDTILISRPLYHCAVLTGEFLTALRKGTKIEFYSHTFNPSSIVNILKEREISVFGGTPTILTVLARYTRYVPIPSLKHIVVSGECMSDEVGYSLQEAFAGARIYHVYGLTEACPRISYMPPEHFPQAPGCVGVPLASVNIKITDPDGSLIPVHTRGILWVQGKNVMQGYYNDPKQTAAVLQDGWLCTGDIASIDEHGWLKIHGRNDDLIIRAGMNIYPQEIEAAIKTDPRTKEVLVYGYTDPKHGTQIAMNISGNFKSQKEVHDLCKAVLSPHQLPTKINITDELPKNGSGKIKRVKQQGEKNELHFN